MSRRFRVTAGPYLSRDKAVGRVERIKRCWPGKVRYRIFGRRDNYYANVVGWR